ncbi:ATPase [Candidatus Roizmanbacteria bacterium CG07_land_8_20_14_0_80_34_15]|uniref:ATPase n=1 Tax=Candidatus Roizmanbacteria bacterium CG07_land_8_20_14_0_80_34_15 TaxID=1974849 RepID=A0A2M6YT39_9BACT|nr:MAG: ATPase [Candidatus Roizmanbacteria bacterium CG07_land_8_20_14_0_80_34_15]
MYIKRYLEDQIEKRFFKNKIIIIYGARQVGKTTLVKKLLGKYQNKFKTLYLNCEILSVRENLKIPEPIRLKSYFEDAKLVVLDEAQKIENIGLILKLLVDTYPEIQIIATGSSSFEINNKINEPLTGRADKFILYPLSIEEIGQNQNRFEIEARLDRIIRYGLYPETYFLPEKQASFRLDEISSDYLSKDILNFEGIKKSRIIIDLLQLLALQLGGTVSYHEIATQLGISRITVQKYIDILEQAFIIFTLRAFSRNLRKEISKSVKIYFYDIGIRNSLIQNYNPINLRADVGGLWENFCLLERLKHNHNHQILANYYFWRTYDQKEVDLIEEKQGRFNLFEFKWKNTKAKIPQEFMKTYKGSNYHLINKFNYWDLLKV